MVTFVLHTHLPYVLHHGTWPHGSDWLCEAVAECYIPLLRMCERLLADGIRPGITFDISPILCEQLSSTDFVEVYNSYCTSHVELAEIDAEQFEADGNTELSALATSWARWYESRRTDIPAQYKGNIVAWFSSLQDRGAIEVITCGATHGYLPLLAEDSSVHLQVQLAVTNYERHFGKKPRGIWLPECAYRPPYLWRTYLPVAAYSVARWREGVEQVLAKHGLEYFVTDQGALSSSVPIGMRQPDGSVIPFQETFGDVRHRLATRSALQLFRAGSESSGESVTFFTRSQQIALQVWSGETGYPGDPDYLDFHKKYFKSAMRYWRVTDNKADMQYKQPYNPSWAEKRAIDHARHFTEILEVTARYHFSDADTMPTICLPFDTELFGHWWFEGPLFLEHVLRGIHGSQLLAATTTSERADQLPTSLVVALPESSWGKNGNHDVWMNPDVQWTWEREYLLERRFRMLMEKHSADSWDTLMSRLILNGFRQLLLAQASDWQFLITTFSSREYAEMRFHNHATDAMELADAAERYAVSGELSKMHREILEWCERRDNIFSKELTMYLRGRSGGSGHGEEGSNTNTSGS